MTIYRHGDVIVRRINTEIPEEAESWRDPKDGRMILAYGEVTGHAHAVSGDADLLEVPVELVERGIAEIEKYLRVNDGGAVITHEEHATINLPPGVYAVVRQREYTSADMEPRYVAD
jgi:hypothetical protein